MLSSSWKSNFLVKNVGDFSAKHTTLLNFLKY